MMLEPIELLQRLIRIPSVNPAYRAVGEAAGEAELAHFVAPLLGDMGFEVELPDVFPGRPNLVALRRARGEQMIGLCAHLDTMSSAGMTVPAFEAEIRDGFVWGRGSADTKASIAAIMAAVSAEIEAGAELPSLLILLTCNEEAGFDGARHFARSSHPPIAGMMIGEPTGLKLVGAHKGVLRTTIRAAGVAAHASVPEQGVNAIYRMADAVKRLERLAGELAKRPGHPLLGHPTLSVGTIAGGTAVNTVPDSCVIQVDRRVLPGEDAERVVRELSAALAGVDGVTIGAAFVNVPGVAIDSSHPWAAAAAQALGQPSTNIAPYATDASILAPAGIACLVYGPGELDAAHSADEHVAVGEVRQAVEGYRSILRRSATL